MSEINKTQPTKPSDSSKRMAEIRNCDFACSSGAKISRKFKFSVGQILLMVAFVKDLFLKNVEIADIEKEIISRFGLDRKEAASLAIEILSKRLLIADKEWFGGEVANKLKELGANLEDYQDYLKEYLVEFEKEQAIELEEKKRDEEEERREQGSSSTAFIEKRLAEVPQVIKDPEGEKTASKQGFAQYLVPVLRANDFILKIDLNIRLITLLVGDESKVFQKELLDVVYKNDEQLTSKELLLKKEKLEPTIGNWLKDYIHFVGVEDVVSTIKKAQYFTNSANVKALDADEKKLLDKLLDFYINLKNFYVNTGKYDPSEIYIFNLSDEEQAAFGKEIDDLVAQVPGEEKAVVKKDGGQSIEDLLQEKVADEKKINIEKERIVKDTRKEFDKVAEIFEEVLLRRKRYPIIACLEILAETGSLDNLLAKDARFTSLLLGYFKRNNLQSEEADFKKDPYQAKYIQHFLKYVFLERIGLSESDGARFAVKVSNIFRSTGANQYAQLAYLDLGDNKFKWTENL
jgi:hypothetical protein